VGVEKPAPSTHFNKTSWTSVMLRYLTPSIIVAISLVAPTLSFAQNNEQVTRAEVTADLVQLESVRYMPGNHRNAYSADIALAEARVAAQGDTASSYDNGITGSAALDTRK
jgi:hypothetical protein